MTAAAERSATRPRLEVAHNRRRTAVNFLAMTGSSALSMLVGVLTSIFVRRMLGPVAIGQVNWNLAVLSYLNLVANPGLQTIGARELAKAPDQTVPLASLIVTLQLAFGCVAYAIVLVIAWLEPRGPEVSTLLVWQGLNVFVSALTLEWALRAHERMVAFSVVALAVNLAQFPFLVLFVHGPEDVLIYAISSLPFTLLGAAYNLAHLIRHGYLRLSKLRPTLAGAAALLRESWPIALSQAAVLVYWNSGAIILGFSSGDEAVGLYSTAARLILMPTILSGAMLNAYFSVLSRATGEPAEAARIAREFLILLAWMGLPLTALGWACGAHLVDMMYGTQFHQSAFYFQWLSLNVGLSFVNIGIGLPLQAWGYQSRYLTISLLAALANLAASMALIPAYGAWGAVAATVLAEALVLVLQIIARRRIGFGWHPMLPALMPPLLCSSAVAAAVWLMPQTLAQHWWSVTLLASLALAAGVVLFERRIVVAALKVLKRS
jgi:O-antigen/teichoic acid export membrane protein